MPWMRTSMAIAVLVIAVLILGYGQAKTTVGGPAQKPRSEARQRANRAVSALEAGSHAFSVSKTANLRQVLAATVRQVDAGSSASDQSEDDLSDKSEDDLLEDELMAMYDHEHTPIQKAWRATYVHEEQDDAWTTRMAGEIQASAKTALLEGSVKVYELSCRETICRMHLQFADQLDAKAYIGAERDPAISYEFQSLDPGFTGDGFDKSEHTYELLVKRPRPAGLQ